MITRTDDEFSIQCVNLYSMTVHFFFFYFIPVHFLYLRYNLVYLILTEKAKKGMLFFQHYVPFVYFKYFTK